MGTQMLTTMKLNTPVGTLWLGADGDELVELSLPERPAPVGTERSSAVLVRAADQLTEYFAGQRRDFDLPLAPRGTPFQVAVWWALARIPFGATCSYGELARVVGRPSASRAVGAANGQNPLAIILPCHRVIGASGDLTGYGGGLPLKRWLLDHERGSVQPSLPGVGRAPRARGAAR
jgi:methylated-DNA-[protein]-cysteine S-methyltransferase